MKQTADKLEFCRHLTCLNVDGSESSSLIVQPYCLGMYVVVTVSGSKETIQLNMTYKALGTWIKDSVKKMEGNGHTVKVVMKKLCDYLSIEEINDYILK